MSERYSNFYPSSASDLFLSPWEITSFSLRFPFMIEDNSDVCLLWTDLEPICIGPICPIWWSTLIRMPLGLPRGQGICSPEGKAQTDFCQAYTFCGGQEYQFAVSLSNLTLAILGVSLPGKDARLFLGEFGRSWFQLSWMTLKGSRPQRMK